MTEFPFLSEQQLHITDDDSSFVTFHPNLPVKWHVLFLRCEYMNNYMQRFTLEEGVPVVLEESDILKSTDVVIILEAHHCNTILAEKKPINRFGTFIKELNEELVSSGLHHIR